MTFVYTQCPAIRHISNPKAVAYKMDDVTVTTMYKLRNHCQCAGVFSYLYQVRVAAVEFVSQMVYKHGEMLKG